MWAKKSNVKFNSKTGVAKIVRASYATVNGMTKKNSWWELRKLAWERDGGKCVDHKLRGQIVVATDVHHIRKLSAGGTNTLSNLICLCDKCHERRHPSNKHLKLYHNR